MDLDFSGAAYRIWVWWAASESDKFHHMVDALVDNHVIDACLVRFLYNLCNRNLFHLELDGPLKRGIEGHLFACLIARRCARL